MLACPLCQCTSTQPAFTCVRLVVTMWLAWHAGVGYAGMHGVHGPSCVCWVQGGGKGRRFNMLGQRLPGEDVTGSHTAPVVSSSPPRVLQTAFVEIRSEPFTRNYVQRRPGSRCWLCVAWHRYLYRRVRPRCTGVKTFACLLFDLPSLFWTWPVISTWSSVSFKLESRSRCPAARPHKGSASAEQQVL